VQEFCILAHHSGLNTNLSSLAVLSFLTWPTSFLTLTYSPEAAEPVYLPSAFGSGN
jgi:hypothetical protein